MSDFENAPAGTSPVGTSPIGTSPIGNDELLSRLRLIEDQPLAERASSFAHVHDELQASLERGDAHSRNG